MKRASDTVYYSDDQYVACAMLSDGRFAYLENDPDGLRLLKVSNTLEEVIKFSITLASGLPP